MSHFSIVCRNCGKVLPQVYCAFCEHCTGSLLVTRYKEARFREGDRGRGVWRFNWLPVHSPRGIPQSGPVVYRSEGLARRLGLRELWVAFNGYWPERGALIETCTFKEFEAAVVLANARENGVAGLTVASAGNTARAFAHLSQKTGYPVTIVVPSMCLQDMWYLETSSLVPTMVIEDGDYSDAIDVARRFSLISGMPFEGGVKNVAKRDGLGIVMLEAVSAMGRMPGHYVQAVGSGAGAIAAWEMSERFLRDGRFDGRLPRLHLAQNLPFAPMSKAWQRGSREMDPADLEASLIACISTRVLSSRYPAYGVRGGVYDALTATGGNMYAVTNEEMAEARDLFEECEGVDIVPAAAVAVAALGKAVTQGAMGDGEPVLLNITGGGEKRLKEQKKTYAVGGERISKDISDAGIEELLCGALKRNSSR
jgi:cysteate synthase